MSVEIYRLPQLTRLLSLSRSTIWRMEIAGEFPARLRLGKRSVGWAAESVHAWIASRQPCNYASTAKTVAVVS